MQLVWLSKCLHTRLPLTALLITRRGRFQSIHAAGPAAAVFHRDEGGAPPAAEPITPAELPPEVVAALPKEPEDSFAFEVPHSAFLLNVDV